MGRWILGRTSGIPADFFAGTDDITKRESLGSRLEVTSNALSNLRLLLVLANPRHQPDLDSDTSYMHQ